METMSDGYEVEKVKKANRYKETLSNCLTDTVISMGSMYPEGYYTLIFGMDKGVKEFVGTVDHNAFLPDSDHKDLYIDLYHDFYNQLCTLVDEFVQNYTAISEMEVSDDGSD